MTTTFFNLTHRIQSPVWILVYRTLIVDGNFPHHLNLFSNVGIFGGGNYNVTTIRSTTIDYTALANGEGYTHNTFSQIGATDLNIH